MVHSIGSTLRVGELVQVTDFGQLCGLWNSKSKEVDFASLTFGICVTCFDEALASYLVQIECKEKSCNY